MVKIQRLFAKTNLKIPVCRAATDAAAAVSFPRGVGAEEYREDGVFYRATVKIDDLHRFEAFLV